MEKLNISLEELSESSLVDRDIIYNFLNSKETDTKLISIIDLEFLLEALYLPKDCIDKLNDNNINIYVNNSLIKSKIDLVMEDFDFLMKVYNEQKIKAL
ncbi:hypothetical protein [Clostridium perfringens]|nr:hypothetical protein [Clostridium perfringens]